MALRYAAVPGLRLRQLDDGLLVFQPLSWEVHILNPAAEELLEACVQQPRSIEDLTRLLAGIVEHTDSEEFASQCETLVEELVSLELLFALAADAVERVVDSPVAGKAGR